jgi:serine O-acetyltransferase
MGKNCNVGHCVTIGRGIAGARKGRPVLGDDVWIGPGSVIVGKITIGNDVLIAPNTFVNFDVPDHSIVIGSPGKVIAKENPTEDYLHYKV